MSDPATAPSTGEAGLASVPQQRYQVRIMPGAFGRFYLAHPARDDSGWTGSGFAPCSVRGFPTGISQICNFVSVEEASAYAKGQDLEVIVVQHFTENQPANAVPGAQGQNVTGPAPVSFADLQAVLEESVRLQSHYAGLLNMHDGGARLKFASAEKWIARLIVTGILKPDEPTVDWNKRAAILHDQVHEVAALVDAHTHVEIGWAPEDAIPMLAEALRDAYEEGRRAH